MSVIVRTAAVIAVAFALGASVSAEAGKKKSSVNLLSSSKHTADCNKVASPTKPNQKNNGYGDNDCGKSKQYSYNSKKNERDEDDD